MESVKKKIWKRVLGYFLLGIFLGIGLLGGGLVASYEFYFHNKVYWGVKIGEENFGGKTQGEVKNEFERKNHHFPSLIFILKHKDKEWTITSQELDWGYNEELLAVQAYSLGRSSNPFSNNYQKLLALRGEINLSPSFRFQEEKLENFLKEIGKEINIEPQDALFNFQAGKVVAFRLSSEGQILDIPETKKILTSYFLFSTQGLPPQSFTLELPITRVKPKVTTQEINNFGIKELLGRGSSRFAGSIANRVHNIQLAASRLNGILVAPEEEFSFNQALGDVSSFTGYKEAYIIKDRRTVLGDGGGVCQVSTTFFRALLNAGLPIRQRHPHSYRVGYYEQDSPVGFDASVYAPSWDLKFKNDTGSYILIQSFTNPVKATLVFELYGTSDGRKVTITQPIIKNQVRPLPDLYQDDPTLGKGQIKQIDWSAWGADVSFERKVNRGGEVIIAETFSSHYQPWQAVYLRGTKE